MDFAMAHISLRFIHSGDVVYAVKLEKPDYINRNEICAIAKANNEALMKRVKEKIYNKKYTIKSI